MLSPPAHILSYTALTLVHKVSLPNCATTVVAALEEPPHLVLLEAQVPVKGAVVRERGGGDGGDGEQNLDIDDRVGGGGGGREGMGMETSL